MDLAIMTTFLSKLSMLFTALLLLVAAPGCDQDEPGEPSDRGARVVMELDGELVQTWDVAAPEELQADLTTWVASTPDACEDGDAELDLVLEVDGEELASFAGCAPADGSDAQPSDVLTASPDPQGNFWCTNCAIAGDCLPCCKCAGHGTGYCANICV
jgi:hypothetical protein